MAHPKRGTLRRWVIALLLGSSGWQLSCAHKHYTEGIDDGYLIGSSDAVKRHYWLQVRSERRVDEEARTAYYEWEAPLETVDGRKLVPHKVVVKVEE